MNTDKAICLMIVDDSPDVVAAMRRVFERERDITVVGTAANADALTPRAAELGATVVLLDLTMPGKAPLDAVTELGATLPEVGIVVCSGYDSAEDVDTALEAGADRFVSKLASPAELVMAVREAAASGAGARRQEA